MKELDNVIAFIKVFFKSGPPKVILEMVKREFTLNDLDSLPSGVSLFFQESLYSCKINPPGDWPREAYVLIEREDLAKLFTGCQIRTLNQNIGPEEVLIFS
jgi:anaphase-promoting complex subunit 1